MSFDADETGTYVLRLQPQLYQGDEYSLSIAVGSSIAFLVSGNNGRPGSFWGDSRDGGKCRHEVLKKSRGCISAWTDGTQAFK